MSVAGPRELETPMPGFSPQRVTRSVVKWTFVLMALVSVRVEAQTGTVTGTVTSESGQTLAAAQVSIVGTSLGTRTGLDGKYTIVNVPVGPQRVRVQFIGHRPMDQQVNVTAGTV